ncbi:MAG: response regulator, partial [Proteobacteria bacterium]|nr:response regulator [Pseudomonadota bacterium]
LRELGFTNVAVVGDIKACLGMVEAEEIGWIISPMVDANDLSVLQLLEVMNSQANLRTIKVSILRDDNDELLPKAFSLGAFSCHKFSMNREACHEDFTKLFGILDKHEHDFAKVAADYLGDYLHEAKLYGEMRSLFASLLQVYPGNPAYLLELAHANLALGKDDIGRILLQQAKMSGTLPAERIRAVCQEFFSTDEPPEESQQFLAEHLGFRSCLVVDPTPESLAAIKKTLEQLGFHNVICHADPVSALKWLRQNKKIDLIISEWKLPQLPGPVFLYKLRNKLGLDIPLLIINEAIEEKEIPLLNELGASRLLRKPIDPQLMSRDIIWILQQHTNPTEPSVIRQKLRLASQRQDLIETKKLKQLYLSLPTLLEGDKLLIEAQVALDTGCFLHAKKHALAAMKKGGDFKESMEILGKSLMKLREFDAALRCLANVSIIAPLNVSHLCDIAECQLEKGDTAAFDKSLHQAQDLDEDASRVIETEAKGAIKNGHTEAARKLLSRLKSLKEVMAFMNNRAVSLIRVGNY